MSLFQLHQKFFWQEALMCVSHEARRAGQTRQAVLATHSAGSNTQVLSTGLLYKLSEKNNTEESGEENDRTRLPEAVRSVWDGARCRGDWSADGVFLENVCRKNIQKKYKIAKHRREISKSRDTNNLILWTHLRAYLQGSFPPDLHGEGKKKKKKKLNVLGDQTTSYSLCLEAARAA